jgi:hypothetical protein
MLSFEISFPKSSKPLAEIDKTLFEHERSSLSGNTGTLLVPSLETPRPRTGF